MTTPTARLEDAWPQLTELSDVYTCYSSAVAAWAAYSHPSWESLVNPGLWLVVKPAEDMLFGFGHFRPGLRAALGLARAGSDDADEAVAGILAELESAGRVIVAGDGYRLPWHVAFERRHVPHWFVLSADDPEPVVADPFACRNDLGWQQPARVPIATGDLPQLVAALPVGDPVFALRESFALGDEGGSPVQRFHWLEHSATISASRAPEGAVGVDAIRLLAQHFRDNGQEPDAYRQADDIWSIGRHRAFLARYAHQIAERDEDAALRQWVDEHANSLARRWSHLAPLLMQATLALGAGRSATSSVPDALDELAERESVAAAAFPVDPAAGRVSPAELERV